MSIYDTAVLMASETETPIHADYVEYVVSCGGECYYDDDTKLVYLTDPFGNVDWCGSVSEFLAWCNVEWV